MLGGGVLSEPSASLQIILILCLFPEPTKKRMESLSERNDEEKTEGNGYYRGKRRLVCPESKQIKEYKKVAPLLSKTPNTSLLLLQLFAPHFSLEGICLLIKVVRKILRKPKLSFIMRRCFHWWIKMVNKSN